LRPRRIASDADTPKAAARVNSGQSSRPTILASRTASAFRSEAQCLRVSISGAKQGAPSAGGKAERERERERDREVFVSRWAGACRPRPAVVSSFEANAAIYLLNQSINLRPATRCDARAPPPSCALSSDVVSPPRGKTQRRRRECHSAPCAQTKWLFCTLGEKKKHMAIRCRGRVDSLPPLTSCRSRVAIQLETVQVIISGI